MKAQRTMHSKNTVDHTARVVTVSTRCARGETADRSGPIARERLAQMGFRVAAVDVIPDDTLRIQQTVLRHTDFAPVSLLMFTGGTGPTPDDRTPDGLAGLLDRVFPALATAIHEDARPRTPRAPLARVIVGVRRRTVVVALPGSPGGVEDALRTLRPILGHLLSLTGGGTDPH